MRHSCDLDYIEHSRVGNAFSFTAAVEVRLQRISDCCQETCDKIFTLKEMLHSRAVHQLLIQFSYDCLT